jgi:hypothetical protein
MDDFAANPFTTGRVTVGGSRTGTIETPGDSDWFAVALSAGETYQLRLNSAGLVDPLLELYSGSGTFVTWNDDGGGNLNSLITFRPVTSGTYFLGARAFTSGTGNYALSVSSSSLSGDDFAANPFTTGSVRIGGSSTGRIETTGDSDWFAVSLGAGQTYQFRLNSAGLNDPFLNLYSSSGTLLTSNDDGGGNLNSLITFTPATTATYYLGARAFASGTGNYVVSANALPGSADDFAANTFTAGSVSVGASSRGRIETVRDADWFGVSLTAGQTYQFRLDSAGLVDPFLNLYDASGRFITSNDDGGGNLNSLITFTPTASGRYYLGARAYDSGTGDYVVAAGAVTAAPPATASFDIVVNYSGDPAYRSAFDTAAARWERIITGDLPSVSSTRWGLIDDLLIDASVTDIPDADDGIGTADILGQAGPDGLRSNRIPYHGLMQFDSDDFATLAANGTLTAVIEHEMGHVLGLGTLWGDLRLRTTSGDYIGANGLQQYRALSGDLFATAVPLERSGGSGTAGSHWSEALFRSELMTGFAERTPPMPISALTVGALADIGYAVNYGAADPYTIPGRLTASAPLQAPAIALAPAALEATESASSTAAPAAVVDANFRGTVQTHYQDTPLVVTTGQAALKLSGAITQFSESSIYFFETTTGNNYLVALEGVFEKNDPTTADDIVGSIQRLTFFADGQMVDSFEYRGVELDAQDALQNWHRYMLDSNNYFESRSPSAQNDICLGLGGDDVFALGGGSDVVNGGSGLDTVIYEAARSAYTVSPTAGGQTVADAQGMDQLSGIERICFLDRSIAFDLARGQAAGNTVGVITAAFGTQAIAAQPELVGIGIDAFDAGASMQQVCAAALRVMGSPDNTAFIDTVYRNVFGHAPSAAERAECVGVLDGSGGSLTQAQLLEIAANAALTVTIGLAGLPQTGVEFV